MCFKNMKIKEPYSFTELLVFRFRTDRPLLNVSFLIERSLMETVWPCYNEFVCFDCFP